MIIRSRRGDNLDEPSDEPVLCEKVKTGLKSGQLHIKIPGSSVGSSDLSPGTVNYQLGHALLPTHVGLVRILT